MASFHGAHIWYELVTTEPDAAAAFYGEVVGWKVRNSDTPGMDYRLLVAGDTEVAGLMAMPPEADGAPPGWLGYIGVDDVDAAVQRITAAGGQVHVPATDIPGIGRFSMVGDPQGAVFYVMTPSSEDESTSFALGRSGHCGWNELATEAPEAAFTFYSTLFGWTKDQAMPMGEMGVYQLIARDGEAFGAITPRPPESPATAWNYYFNVDDIDAAIDRIRNRGGQLLHGPHEVPGGSSIIFASDPQGAVFCLVGPRRT
jgi:uncharacterized protein